MATYLTRTFGTPTNATIWTLSFWCKRASNQSASEKIFSAGTSGTDRTEMYFASDGQFWIYRNIGGSAAELGSTPKYRDANAWYHFVIQNNNGTAAVYVNGESVTLSNTTLGTNKINLASTVHKFGEQAAGGQNFFGCLSHVHFADGTIYAPTVFGSTDSTTGEWKINTSPSFTPGNNGFTILKDGNTITDQSANSNNFTVGGGTLTKTEDCPSNVFCTWNPLDHKSTGWNMQNGNTRLQGTGGDSWETRRAISTLGASSGKYYAELKMTTAGNDSYPFGVGYDVFQLSYSSSMGSNSNFWGYYQPAGGQIYGGGTGSPLQTSLGGGTGDVIGIALDIDNLTLQFYKNGSTMGSQITGLPSGKTWFFASSAYGNTNTFDCNFGNGYFGSTQISSAGTNASGIGIFEYNVPTGYTALSTKGLNL